MAMINIYDELLGQPTYQAQGGRFALRRWEVRHEYDGVTSVGLDLMCYSNNVRDEIDRLMTILNSPQSSDAATFEARVTAEVSAMRAEISVLKKERMELMAEIAYWKGEPLKRVLPDKTRQLK